MVAGFKQFLIEAYPSRQHFRMVANLVKIEPNAKKRQRLADYHAEIFAKQNPRFSHEKFHTWIGTKYTPKEVKEETEQLDETSKTKAKRYVDKAEDSDKDMARRTAYHNLHGEWDKAKASEKKRERRYGFVMRAKRKLKEETLTEADTLSLSVPLFIRMLEYAREDAKTDMDLHKVTENALSIGGVLDMENYNKIVGK